MPPPMGSPEERTISYRNPSGSFMSSSSLGWMASNETAAPCPPGEPADPDEPFSSCEPPCWPPSSPPPPPPLPLPAALGGNQWFSGGMVGVKFVYRLGVLLSCFYRCGSAR